MLCGLGLMLSLRMNLLRMEKEACHSAKLTTKNFSPPGLINLI
jgi:hypothetical protein